MVDNQTKPNQMSIEEIFELIRVTFLCFRECPLSPIGYPGGR